MGSLRRAVNEIMCDVTSEIQSVPRSIAGMLDFGRCDFQAATWEGVTVTARATADWRTKRSHYTTLHSSLTE